MFQRLVAINCNCKSVLISQKKRKGAVFFLMKEITRNNCFIIYASSCLKGIMVSRFDNLSWSHSKRKENEEPLVDVQLGVIEILNSKNKLDIIKVKITQ